MHQPGEHCPTCGRAFASIHDFPRVRVLDFERLPIPEAVDQMSAAALEKWQTRRSMELNRDDTFRQEGINMTPAIARLCEMSEVRNYVRKLEETVGQEVIPNQLLPPFKAHGHFRWAYPVVDTGLYLSLGEADAAAAGERVAEVQVHCNGPNLGAAGGPTLQSLGAVAQIRYRGLLL